MVYKIIQLSEEKYTMHNSIVWMDLEMSGLEPRTDLIIESSCVITDHNLNVLATGPEFTIKTSEQTLNNMDEWNTKQHKKTGLWNLCLRKY